MTDAKRIKVAGGSRTGRRLRALILVAHEPTVDPRIGWIANSLLTDYDEVCEIGTYRSGESGDGPSFEKVNESRHRVRVERTRHDWDWLGGPASVGRQSLATEQLMRLCAYAHLPAETLSRQLSAGKADTFSILRFRGLCNYFINTNSALSQAARLTGNFDVIIAADLETLPAALIIAEKDRSIVVYDAHEFWPYSYIDFSDWEASFWTELERSLVKHADLRVTVSPPLAAALEREYDCEFISAPNCLPLAEAPNINPKRSRKNTGEVYFLYQGVFAPGRGIDILIKAWAHVNAPAQLLLRGPDNAFKLDMISLAKSLGLAERRVFFPQAVKEQELLAAASEADVGIIPYEAINVNNRLSCPNKFSQYLAAGLPVLSNELDFVKATVSLQRIGSAVDFQDTEQLVRAIERLSNRETLAEMSRRARAFFQSQFNWETTSSALFQRIRNTIGGKRDLVEASLDFSWIESGREMRTPASSTGLENVALASPTTWRGQLVLLATRRQPRVLARGLLSMMPPNVASMIKKKLVKALDSVAFK